MSPGGSNRLRLPAGSVHVATGHGIPRDTDYVIIAVHWVGHDICNRYMIHHWVVSPGNV